MVSGGGWFRVAVGGGGVVCVGGGGGSGWSWVVVGGECRSDVYFRIGYIIPTASSVCIFLEGVRDRVCNRNVAVGQCLYIFLKAFVTALTVWLPWSMFVYLLEASSTLVRFTLEKPTSVLGGEGEVKITLVSLTL